MASVEDISTGGDNMASDNKSENARLVSTPSNAAKPSYINVFSNLCALIFVSIMTYCSFVNGVTLFSFHPIFMSLGWMLCMTTAINAITPGDLATEWMPIRLRSARHWVLQVLTAIIVLVGFSVILINKFANNKSHFVSLHAKFGLAAVILMAGTMLGGVGALYSLKLKQYLAPIYTKLLHSTVGLITFILGIISIILGLYSGWWKFGEALRYTSFALVLIVMLFTILRPSLKIYFRLKERFVNVN